MAYVELQRSAICDFRKHFIDPTRPRMPTNGMPELGIPKSPEASRIASAVPTESLYVEEPTTSERFKILLTNFDGRGDNWKWARINFSERQ